MRFAKFEVRVLADSIGPSGQDRLVTMELTYPHCVHAEFMAHRQFSRDASSGSAIPPAAYIERVQNHPFIPIAWGLAQLGTQPGGGHEDRVGCRLKWADAHRSALEAAHELNELGLHGQVVSRVLEPYAWVTTICTGVAHAWEHFFTCKCAKTAEPHLRQIAQMARVAFDGHAPKPVGYDEYHLPLTGRPGDESLVMSDLVKVCVARCACVAFLTHTTKRSVAEDLAIYEQVKAAGHWSPFEHVAQPAAQYPYDNNFGRRWHQYRKCFAGTEYPQT